jgi:hypothetical protein
MSLITPVILVGSTGKRLWPLSRESMPKQFVPLLGRQSTFQQTLLRVTLDGKILTLHENDAICIPIGAIRRLANPGSEPLEIVEVQTGDYLDEDDIVRYEDSYARV